MDFLYEIKENFSSTVTEHLDKLSREALLSQEDPATMRDCTAQRIRRAIMNRIFGNVNHKTPIVWLHESLRLGNFIPLNAFSQKGKDTQADTEQDPDPYLRLMHLDPD